MKLLLESSINDPATLKTFIKYEVLRNKPAFESYKSFCEIVGDDVMPFPEFEFWFMRFYNDLVDVNYDRSQDPKPMTLSELPLEMIDEVIKRLDSDDKNSVRYVSKSIRQCVESPLPSIDRFRVFLSDFYWSFTNEKGDYHHSIHKETNDGCLIYIDNLKKIVAKGQNFMRTAMEDMKSMANWKTPLKSLQISVKSDTWFKNKKEINSILKEFQSKLHIQCVKASCEPALYSFLKMMKPGILEKIEMKFSPTQAFFEKIFNTEQWKQAKTICCRGDSVISEKSLYMFYHLVSFIVRLHSVSKKTLIELKNNIMVSESFEKCEIRSKELPSIKDIRAVFGAKVQKDKEVCLTIPGSYNYLYVIKFESMSFKIERKRS